MGESSIAESNARLFMAMHPFSQQLTVGPTRNSYRPPQFEWLLLAVLRADSASLIVAGSCLNDFSLKTAMCQCHRQFFLTQFIQFAFQKAFPVIRRIAALPAGVNTVFNRSHST